MTILDVDTRIDFVDWVNKHYIKLGKVWCSKKDNRFNEDNYKTISEIYNIYQNKIEG